MRQLLLLSTLLFTILTNTSQLNAQSSFCNNSLFGFPILPLPDTTQGANPQLGINLDAYNNCNYEYTFTMFITDSVVVQGGPVDITSIEVVGITGTPLGISNFQCDPPTCLFGPNSVNTVTISGIPNDAVGDYLLEIQTEFITSAIPVPITLTFPNPTIAPGEYKLTLQPTPPTCTSCAGFSVQVNKVDDLCDVGDGSVNFVASGGTPPYSYAFCGSVPSGNTVSGLYTDTYILEVVDAEGCKIVEAVEIIGASSINVSSTNETCLLNDGTASISTSGSNFTYLWNTGATTQTINGLSTGYYASTTTDIVNLCNSVDTIFVAQDSTCIVYLNGQVVWDDQNPDCTIDPTSRYPQNKLIYLFKNGQLAGIDNTDYLGRYSFTVDTGIYVLRVATDPYEVFACPTIDSVIINALTPNASYQEDFYQTLIPHQDLCVEYLNGPARPGFDQWHTLVYCNYGTDTISGTISFVHDSILLNFDANGTEDSYDPVTFTAIWSFTNLPPGSCQTINFKTTIPVSATLGEILVNTATVGPTTNDVDLENNTSTVYTTVTGSYDPNDKQNLIAESTFSGPIYEDDDQFHYFIRFQNTGTDTAFTVVVKDELDANLNLSSFSPRASSHPYNLTIEDQRTLVFTFNNILLVDSTTNEPASHGFISFAIDLEDPNLPLGSVIENTAGIYFDFNAPIITNTVVNTISAPLSIPRPDSEFFCHVYPNPTDASAMLHLTLKTAEQISIELIDVTGKQHAIPHDQTLFVKGEHMIPINLEGLSDGIWILNIRSETTNQSLKLMKL